MANYDYILVYNAVVERWLKGEGCCVPSALPGNRYPTMQEVVAAVEDEGMQAIVDGEDIMVMPPPDAPSVIQGMTRQIRYWEVFGGLLIESTRSPTRYLVRFHSFHWDELNINPTASITMRGDSALELFLVRNLTERCGQLVLYPDSGDPPVVVEPQDDIGHKARVWLNALESQCSWRDFYQNLQLD